jgi:hypothetical protein
VDGAQIGMELLEVTRSLRPAGDRGPYERMAAGSYLIFKITVLKQGASDGGAVL